MSEQSKYFPATDKAKAFVKSNIAIDSLSALLELTWIREEMFEEYFDRALESGIDSVGLTISYGATTFDVIQDFMPKFLNHIYAQPDKFTIARTAGDIKRAKEDGKLAFFFNAQGCESLDHNPSKYMPILKNMGVGTMALAYNERFRAGDGCLVKDPGEVTFYGKTVLDAMVKNRILVDMSHAASTTAVSAMNYCIEKHPGVPVIYTHSNPLGVFDIYRNITDEEMQLCAKTGGIIGITLLPWFLVSLEAADLTPADIVRAVDYIVERVGIDAVALASDDTFCWDTMWKWTSKVPEMYQDGGLTETVAKLSPGGSGEPSKIYAGTVDALWQAGYSDEDIAKILGGNLMRVYSQVWGE
jgi:membrane dipeptidase